MCSVGLSCAWSESNARCERNEGDKEGREEGEEEEGRNTSLMLKEDYRKHMEGEKKTKKKKEKKRGNGHVRRPNGMEPGSQTKIEREEKEREERK